MLLFTVLITVKKKFLYGFRHPPPTQPYFSLGAVGAGLGILPAPMGKGPKNMCLCYGFRPPPSSPAVPTDDFSSRTAAAFHAYLVRAELGIHVDVSAVAPWLPRC